MLLPYHNTSTHSTTSYYKALLHNDFSTTTSFQWLLPVLQHFYKYNTSTTPYYNSSPQYYCSTTPYNTYYYSTTSYSKVRLQYYSVRESTTPVLFRTSNIASKVRLQYYKVRQSTTPILLCITKHYSSTTPYYNEHYSDLLKRLPSSTFPYYATVASETSISCETSSTFQATSFQNERFVRGFRNFSSNKLPKRAFRTRLPQLFKQQASKTSISCEASATFQKRSFQSLAPATQNAKMTSHLESLQRQNEHFVRDFLQIPHFRLENRRFRASFSYKAIFTELKKYESCEASATFHDTHQMLRRPRYLQGNVTFAHPCHCDLCKQHLRHITKCCACHDIAKGHITKCCACHEKNDALALTRFQSIAPVTQNAKMTSLILRLRNAKTSISCETSFTFHTWSVTIASQCECTAQWREINELATTRRRRHDDDTTHATRTQVQPQTPTINGNPSLRIREKKIYQVGQRGTISKWPKCPRVCTLRKNHHVNPLPGRRRVRQKSGNFVACLVVSALVGSWRKVMGSYRTMRPWRIGWTQMWYLEVVEEISRREMIYLGCTCWIPKNWGFSADSRCSMLGAGPGPSYSVDAHGIAAGAGRISDFLRDLALRVGWFWANFITNQLPGEG